MLVSAAHFHRLYKQRPNNPAYKKYTRDFLSSIFDNLHLKSEFAGKLKRQDFPLMAIRGVPKSYHGFIDLDDDSDGEVNPGLFADCPPSVAADPEFEGDSARAFTDNIDEKENRMLAYGEGSMSSEEEEMTVDFGAG